MGARGARKKRVDYGREPGVTSWTVTSRFLRDYARASGPLRSLAEQEVRHPRLRSVSVADWTAGYRRLRGVPDASILELELGGGPRLLVHIGHRTATLLTMAGHEITRRYQRGRTLRTDLESTSPLPPALDIGYADPLLPAPGTKPGRLIPWGPEFSRDWFYFLDEEQTEICDGLIESIEDVLADDDLYTVNFLIGGPGTGKDDDPPAAVEAPQRSGRAKRGDVARRSESQRPARRLHRGVHRLEPGGRPRDRGGAR
jgi:hypothetical protein